MKDILIQAEQQLPALLKNSELHSMYIDYHPPFVKRIWLQYGEYRIYMHRIEPCSSSPEALYHPHPWHSAIRIVRGHYEMGVGHSASNELPPTDCKLLLGPGTLYEMTEPDGWHYVNPLDKPVYSLMVTGKRSERPMPLEPKKEFRKLNREEQADILRVFNTCYGWGWDDDFIASLVN